MDIRVANHIVKNNMLSKYTYNLTKKHIYQLKQYIYIERKQCAEINKFMYMVLVFFAMPIRSHNKSLVFSVMCRVWIWISERGIV